MRLPTIQGIIDRRILVNYRVDPERLAAILPKLFRPQLVAGYGMAGICLIRLKKIRPRWMPSMLGISSENAAHRIAVEWQVNDQTHTGVYVPRRDTSSLLNVLAGGRLFPGEHSHARFDISEANDHYHIAMQSTDGQSRVAIRGRTSDRLPNDSVFDSVTAASDFFECGSLGYSPNARGCGFDGIELRSFNWQVQPLEIEAIESSFFNDKIHFPAGSAQFDHALLMQGIDHEWHSRKSLPG